MKNRNAALVGGTVALLAVIFLMGAYLYKNAERKRIEALAGQRAQLFEREHSPTLGPQTAKVTLVEFLDPECESCRMFYPFVKQLLEENKEQLRLVVRYAPLHGNSILVIKLLEAARMQGKYWETLEIFFKNQPAWGDHHRPNPDLLWTYLPQVGVDVEKVRKDMNDPAIEKIIEQDISDGRELGVRQTPGFFVNGKPLVNFGYEQLRELIQGEL